jgi:hypothetical protein
VRKPTLTIENELYKAQNELARGIGTKKIYLPRKMIKEPLQDLAVKLKVMCQTCVL